MLDETKTLGEPEMLDDLLNFIDEQEVQELGITTEDNFAIQSRSQADYLTGEYVKLQQEVDEVERTAKEALEKYAEKINRWKEAEIRKRESPMNWLGSRLRAYAAQQLEGSKRKSLSLPNGALKFSKKSAMHYDEEQLFAFLEKHQPQFLKEQPKKIDKAGLKKACEEHGGRFYLDGAEVAGMTVEVLPDTFKVG